MDDTQNTNPEMEPVMDAPEETAAEEVAEAPAEESNDEAAAA